MDLIERILNAKTIPGLNRAVSNFWFGFNERESDDILHLLMNALTMTQTVRLSAR